MGPSTHRMNPPVLKGLQEQQYNSMNFSMETVHLLRQEIMEPSSLHQMEPLGLQGLPVQQTISMEESILTQIPTETKISFW